ncbi:MAG: NAD(P)/FAD-dependent oxidoreductase [Verrucomicrobia bacterium]|nr:NAD(P)/FAD-dependent oxidoreductase [Verrucomicrobiota bacterium]
MPGPRKVLIIGGGFAGLACAQKLANDSRFAVTLIDRRNHHLFQPLLYQVATASLAAPDIARSLRGVLASAANVTVLLDDITTIDCDTHTARSADNTYPFDSLVLATGAHTSFFGKDEWASHTVGLKSLEDAQTIRRRVLTGLERAECSADPDERRRLMTVVIVGGGPTGVELAGAFSDLVRRALKADFRRINPADLRILLVQSGDRILKPFQPDLSDYARQRLEDLGVEICLEARVDEVESGRVHLDTGRWIEAATIIWAAGVQASDLTACLPGERDRGGRLLVSPALSIPGHPDLFAAGDIVSVPGPDGEPVPGLAPAASQMGRHIAAVLREDQRLATTRYARRKSEFRAAFRYRDKGIMAIIGKNCAVAQAGRLKMRGILAWAAWLFIHLLFLIGFRNKLAVLLQWGWAYLVDKPGARVITGHDDKVA